MRFDPQGNLYSISETNPGYVYRFIPDRPGDLSSGQLYALRITHDEGDRTGEAEWMPLDRATVQVNADAAAAAVGATGYDRPEDVELATSTGNARAGGANRLYVSVTEPEETRVLAIDLREPSGGSGHDTAYVYDYVRRPGNAPDGFEWPDNLALDSSGNLYIAEDPPSNPGRGADIWAAEPPRAAGQHLPASRVVRFASLTDCASEPTGIYFAKGESPRLFVNAQHRGGDGIDEAVEIRPAGSR
jgi:secreted PhoX family phosphatase